MSPYGISRPQWANSVLKRLYCETQTYWNIILLHSGWSHHIYISSYTSVIVLGNAINVYLLYPFNSPLLGDIRTAFIQLAYAIDRELYSGYSGNRQGNISSCQIDKHWLDNSVRLYCRKSDEWINIRHTILTHISALNAPLGMSLFHASLQWLRQHIYQIFDPKNISA